ncbi:hypothetical protein Tco_0822618 [Tanacetum coccineum]|uniref:Uncharacterized protein n=1 Tax=Tanacetum coccineum TaxID=301880 RepID=A0ABQ5AKI2_9ASTR
MDKCKTRLGYNAAPPPYTRNFMPPKSNLVYPSLDDFVDVNESVSEFVVESLLLRLMNLRLLGKKMEPQLLRIGYLIVNIVKGTRANNARPKAVISVVKGNKGNAVKASACWVWRPKHKVLDHGNPQQDLKNKGVIDSGCSRHITGNRSYLTDYEEIDGRFVAFGVIPKEENYSGKSTNKDCKARVETIPGKDYILLPLWPQDPKLFSSSKDSPDAGFKPSGEEEKKDAEDLENKDSEVPSTEEPRVNQEKDANINSTNNINNVSPTVNAACIEDNVVDENIVYGYADDPNMPNLEEII